MLIIIVCVPVVIVSICLVCVLMEVAFIVHCIVTVFAHTITQYTFIYYAIFFFIPSEKQLIAPNLLYDMPFAG